MERIESLQAAFGGLQNGLSKMELGVNDKIQHLEDTINNLPEALVANKEGTSNNTCQNGPSGFNREENREDAKGNRTVTKCFNYVDQFFEFQGTTETKKLSFLSFLKDEANPWWQWLLAMKSLKGSR